MPFAQTLVTQSQSLSGGDILNRVGDILLGDPTAIGGRRGGVLGNLLDRIFERTVPSAGAAPGLFPIPAPQFAAPAARALPSVLGGLAGGVAPELIGRFFGGGGGAMSMSVPLFTAKGNPRRGPIGVVNPNTGECMFVANLGPPSGFRDWSRKKPRHHHHPRRR